MSIFLLLVLMAVTGQSASANPKVLLQHDGVRVEGLNSLNETYCFAGPVCEGREVYSDARGQCAQMAAQSMLDVYGTCFQLGNGGTRIFTPKYILHAQNVFSKRALSEAKRNQRRNSGSFDGVESTNRQIKPYNPIFNFQQR